MNAIQHTISTTQAAPAPSRIAIPEAVTLRQAVAGDAQHLQDLAAAAYGLTPAIAESWYPADQFQSRIRIFPEGQIVAVETMTGRIIGFTSAMRFDYDPTQPLLERWDRTTGYG